MSTQTDFLTKLKLVENCCLELNKNLHIPSATPTIDWILGEIQPTATEILATAVSMKKAQSWLRVADRNLDKVYTIKEELPEIPELPETGSDTFLATVLVCILDDMRASKKHGHLILGMLEGAYTIDSLANNKKADEPRIEAYEFVEEIYKKMNI